MSNQQHNINIVVSETGLNQVQSSMQNFASTSTTVVKSQDALAGAMGKTQGAAIKTGKEFENVEKTETKTVKSTGSLGQAFKNSALQITAFVSGLISTVMQVNSVLAAENKLDKMREQLNKRTLALETAELKYNTGIANGTLTGEKARIAAEKLDSMRKLLEIDTEKLTLKENAHAASLTQLALSAIPTVISGAASISQIYGTLSGVIEGASTSVDESAESMDALGTAADTATTTGLIPTAKQILTMIPGVNKLSQIIGKKGDTGDTAVGGWGALNFTMNENQKSSNVVIDAFKKVGSTVNNFFNNMAKDVGKSEGFINKIGASFKSFFGQLGSGFKGLGGNLKALGSSVADFGKKLAGVFIANPILAAITLITTAILGLMFNFGGFRDRINEVGVALGKMFPVFKPILDAMGWFGDLAGKVGNSIMNFGKNMDTTKMSSDQLKLSLDTQIVALGKVIDLGDKAQNLNQLQTIFSDVRTAVNLLSDDGTKFTSTWIKNADAAKNAWAQKALLIKDTSSQTRSIMSQLSKTFEQYRLGNITAAQAQELVNKLLDQLNVSAGQSVDDLEKVALAEQLAADKATELTTTGLNVVNAMNATAEESESVAASLTEQEVSMVKLLKQYGISLPTVENLTQKQKTMINEIANNLPVFEKYGMLIQSNADGTINWDATIKAVAANHQKLTDASTTTWDKINELLGKGVEGYKEAIAYVEILGTKDKTTGEIAQKILTERVELINQNQKALSDFIDSAIVGGDKQVNVEKKVQESQQKSSDKIKEKAISLKIWDDILNLSAKDQENAIKITEKGIKTDNESRLKLQELAVSRGLNINQIGQTSGALLEYIKNSEVEINTIDDVNSALGQIIAKRQDEAKAADLQTKVQTALLEEMGRVPPLLGMTAKGLENLVKTYGDTTKAQEIAVDSVGLWWAELEKSQAIERQELITLEELADRIGVEIPNAIMAKGVPAVKAYIESVIGIGEGAKKARDEALKAFEDLHEKGRSALAGVISDALGEDGDEIKKAIKGIEKTKVSIMALDSQSAIIDVFLDDTDYTNKVQTLDEIYNKEYGEIAVLSQEQGKDIGDKFIQNIIDILPPKAKGIGTNMEAIWNEIKASSAPTDSGNLIVGKLAAALERKELILAAMQQGVKDPVARVMGLTDQEAAALAKNIPTNLADVLNKGKGEVDSAAKTGLRDPVNQNVMLIPNEADTSLAPVEGVFSNAFLKASIAATGQLNLLFADITKSMGFLVTNIGLELGKIESLWIDHATNIGTPIDNIIVKLQLLQKTYETLTLAVKSNMTSMTTYTENFSDDSVTALGKVDKGLQLTQTNVSSTYNVWDKAMDEMSKKVGTFASACTKAFDSVKKDADVATKAVQALQKAIDALKDKTVTITYRIETVGKPPKDARFGGSSVGYARGGDSWIQNKPGRVGNMNVSEFGKPELITVTPLSNPYDVKDKSINIGGGGGSGGTPVMVSGNVYITNVMPDGQVLSKAVKPFLLSGFSGIT